MIHPLGGVEVPFVGYDFLLLTYFFTFDFVAIVVYNWCEWSFQLPDDISGSAS